MKITKFERGHESVFFHKLLRPNLLSNLAPSFPRGTHKIPAVCGVKPPFRAINHRKEGGEDRAVINPLP